MSNQDSELVGKCKRGDGDACAQLLHRYRQTAYRVAFAIVVDHDEAEDVVQEAFVRAFQGMGKFDDRYAFADWMRRITVNCALSSLRRRRRVTAGSPAAMCAAAGSGDPAEHAAAAQFDAAVRKALETLPPRQRVALSLFALQDMDLESTAKAMGCAVGTVKAHIHRGREKLRRALADYLSED